MVDWPVINENGLHDKMITKEEYLKLCELADNKGKKFIVNRNNPIFLMSNEMECYECLQKKKEYPRLVGYKHSNGKKGKYLHHYNRYRCRECGKNILRDDLHTEIDKILDSLVLTDDQINKLKLHLRKIWRNYETELIERSKIAEGRLQVLKDKKGELIQSLSHNPDLAEDIKEEIEKLKQQIHEAEIVAINAKDFERDLIEFTDFALDYVNNWKQNWWILDKPVMSRCKQILFPCGISVTQDKKVYTQKISLVYRYGSTKKASEDADFVVVEDPVRLELTTPCLKGRCSNRLSYGSRFFRLT